jgi:hypothetical protein
VSQNKHYRAAWIQTVYASTVQLFHETRKTDEERDTPLADLARKCANTMFAEAAPTIVGDKETTAREFLRFCREHIAEEILKAVQEDINLQKEQEREALVH